MTQTAKKAPPSTVRYETPMIPIQAIGANPDNPRRNAEATPEMVESVRQHGILEPLVLRPIGETGGFTLIAGHRRLDAARKAGLADVPAHIRTGDDDATLIELALVENLHRENLSPLEEAEGFYSLIELGRTQRQIADMVGVSQPLVSKRLALLRLPPVALAAVEKGRDSGGISIEEGVALAVLDDNEIKALFKRGVPDGHEIRRAVREHVEAKKRKELIAALEAAGVKVTTVRPGWNAAHPPVRLDYLPVDVDEDEHAKLDCHLVYVDERANTSHCCTTPANHPPEEDEPDNDVDENALDADDGEGGEFTPEQRAEAALVAAGSRATGTGRTAEEQLEYERRREEEHAADVARHRMHEAGVARREEFCRQLLADVTTKAAAGVVEVVARLVPAAMEGYEFDRQYICSLLDVAAERGEEVEVLARLTADDDRMQLAFVYALGLDAGATMLSDDTTFDRELDDPALEAPRFFLRHLVDAGYELDTMEQHILGEQLTLDEPPAEEPAEEPSTGASTPTIDVTSRGKRWMGTCTECGPLSKAGNTTETYARWAGANHLFASHGVGDGL